MKRARSSHFRRFWSPKERWDTLSPLERLRMVLHHADVFFSLGLITEKERLIAQTLSESSLRYIVGRESHPLFTGLNIKATFCHQESAQVLEAALRAAFLKEEK